MLDEILELLHIHTESVPLPLICRALIEDMFDSLRGVQVTHFAVLVPLRHLMSEELSGQCAGALAPHTHLIADLSLALFVLDHKVW